jgi:hypothetical protein
MAFRLAKLFAWMGLAALAGLIVSFASALSLGESSSGAGTAIALAVSVIALLVATIGTASTIILGWRADRRQTEEFKLRIQQLEMQLAEARGKGGKLDSSSN